MGWGVLLASDEQKPRMLQTTLQSPGQAPQQRSIWPPISIVQNEKPALARWTDRQVRGPGQDSTGMCHQLQWHRTQEHKPDKWQSRWFLNEWLGVERSFGVRFPAGIQSPRLLCLLWQRRHSRAHGRMGRMGGSGRWRGPGRERERRWEGLGWGAKRKRNKTLQISVFHNITEIPRKPEGAAGRSSN